MKKLPSLILVVVCMCVSVMVTGWMASEQAHAADTSKQNSTKSSSNKSSNEAVRSVIQQRFSQSRPDLVISSAEPSAIAGLYMVKVENGPTLYVTADGSHFIMGDLFQALPGGFVNIAEQAREKDRAQAIKQVDVANMIVFAPQKQATKAVINVFTDVDCYYCQKLHNEVSDLNRAGIEVRYLAFPRAGIGSESYKKIASAWCAKNQQDAITRLKRRESIKENVCEGNPVEDQYILGQKIGVTGTPALITNNGRLMPGYMPTLKLAQALGIEVEPGLAEELLRKQQAAAAQQQ